MSVNSKKKIDSSPSNQLAPLFDSPGETTPQLIVTNNKASVEQQDVAKPKVVATRKANQIGTPSIKKALAGIAYDEKEIENPDIVTDTESDIQTDLPFSIDDVHEIWPQIVERYVDQVHLYNTLLAMPTLDDAKNVVITVENSVQQDKIRSLKPELIGALRRGLKNSKIDVQVDLNRTQSENKILTDEQKLKSMIEKSPALGLLKNKFNLDFNG